VEIGADASVPTGNATEEEDEPTSEDDSRTGSDVPMPAKE